MRFKGPENTAEQRIPVDLVDPNGYYSARITATKWTATATMRCLKNGRTWKVEFRNGMANSVSSAKRYAKEYFASAAELRKEMIAAGELEGKKL